MSVLSGLCKSDFTTASDGLLELSEEKIRSIMRTEPITDVYHVEQEPFARGKFAFVRKIRHLETGAEYAAKFIRKRRRAADSTREIQHEVAVLALCAGTPRVVRLHEVYDARSEVAIVLELAGRELQHILDEEERLEEGAARRALRHSLEGLAHLHSRRIAHLDLKPQNLLLTNGGKDLLICDFGISRAIRPGTVVREILGTRDYVAPEILSYEPLSLAADIWSVGVLAYVLLSGYSPFAGSTKQETYLNIAQCTLSFPEELFEDVSELALDFIRATLVLDPKGRLTVDQCLEHPWLRDDSRIPHTIAEKNTDRTQTNGNHDNTIETTDNNAIEQHNGIEKGDKTDTVKPRNGICEKNGLEQNGYEKNGLEQRNGIENGDKCEVMKPRIGMCEKNGIEHNGYEINGYENGLEVVETVIDEDERTIEKILKHPHGRETSPPFPDAPSTPKVSRKSHPSPPSVLALCKKFQPDFPDKHKEKSCACGCDCACACGECAPRALRPLPPDRAVIC